MFEGFLETRRRSSAASFLSVENSSQASSMNVNISRNYAGKNSNSNSLLEKFTKNDRNHCGKNEAENASDSYEDVSDDTNSENGSEIITPENNHITTKTLPVARSLQTKSAANKNSAVPHTSLSAARLASSRGNASNISANNSSSNNNHHSKAIATPSKKGRFLKRLLKPFTKLTAEKVTPISQKSQLPTTPANSHVSKSLKNHDKINDFGKAQRKISADFDKTPTAVSVAKSLLDSADLNQDDPFSFEISTNFDDHGDNAGQNHTVQKDKDVIRRRQKECEQEDPEKIKNDFLLFGTKPPSSLSDLQEIHCQTLKFQSELRKEFVGNDTLSPSANVFIPHNQRVSNAEIGHSLSGFKYGGGNDPAAASTPTLPATGSTRSSLSASPWGSRYGSFSYFGFLLISTPFDASWFK